MPFESEAQRRMFHAMQGRGEMPAATVKRWEKETGDRHLPMHKSEHMARGGEAGDMPDGMMRCPMCDGSGAVEKQEHEPEHDKPHTEAPDFAKALLSRRSAR